MPENERREEYNIIRTLKVGNGYELE